MNIKEMADEFLVCPKCRGYLEYKLITGGEKDKEILVCNNCRVYYPVKDEIPILLVEEAKSLSE